MTRQQRTPATIAAHVLIWRSPCMPAPAFWYFRDADDANRAALGLRTAVSAEVRPRLVPASTVLS